MSPAGEQSCRGVPRGPSAYLFVTLDRATKSVHDFRQELKGLNISTIQLQDRQELALKDAAPSDQILGSDQGAKARQKAKSKAAYGKAANEVGHLTQSARAGGTLNFKQAKRAIQNIVDLMMQDEATVLGLTTLRCHDQYTHNHSVNVSLLSLALANRAGYPKVELADLGLAALFHDMGKASIPLKVLNKPGEFTGTHPNALGVPFAAGDVVGFQAWFRDPPAPSTTNLTNAVQVTLLP